jgi:hypothetical protein
LKAFEEGINVSVKYGPQVFNIERFTEKDPRFPKGVREYDEFVIEKEE